MLFEPKYAFRQRIDEVHKRNVRTAEAVPRPDEVELTNEWCIVSDIPSGPGNAAEDLRDYLAVSMNIHLPVRQAAPGKVIEIASASGKEYTLDITTDRIALSGDVRSAVHELERRMNLREAPFLKLGREAIRPLFSPRMVHSGWGLDQYPDRHLNAIAHAGFDAILLFVKGVDRTTHGVMDFNDLIRRAANYGLSVYLYSYLESYKHPDDEDADAYFDSVYGKVFQACPQAAGLILVGESCDFPSKDPRSSGRRNDYSNTKTEGIADGRPAPGFYPCSDYPQWLNAVKKAVFRYAPHADVVFWTYNWGNHPRDARIDLIKNLPDDVALEVTFEMFTQRPYENHTMVQPDYSITFPGPGEYFISEAEAAHEQKLRLYAMTNTAGMTWDCGVIPYVPVPQQWFKRFAAMREAHKNWGLSGLMESHHYGWYPSPVCECAAWLFRENAPEPEALLRQIARRDFGKVAADSVVAAWQLWSDAVDSYTPGFDDQAGPLRVGAAYPFVFHPILYPHTEQKMLFPTTEQSAVGARWLHAFYQPEHIYRQTNCGRRIHEDIRIMKQAVELWDAGSRKMDEALKLVPEDKRPDAERQAGVGKFFGCALRTMAHIKKWWLLNKQLEIEYDFDKANAILDEMLELIAAERTNVERAITLAAADSRLGWEPSMDYMADVPHLKWKLRQLDNLVNHTINAYRKTIGILA